MASFMANLFPGGRQDKSAASNDARPSTPTSKNNFVTPADTPQGSPSKKTIPPGANELPDAIGNLRLGANVLDSPIKLGRPQSTVQPLSPGKSNAQAVDESSVVDDSVLHKGVAPGSPLRKQGKENTPPPTSARLGAPDQPVFQHNHAALSRHELYQQRDSRPATPTVKKFNTSRGLTQEELEILQRPNVKRLVNVTQLCKWPAQQ